jgi:hypothetical protein
MLLDLLSPNLPIMAVSCSWQADPRPLFDHGVSSICFAPMQPRSACNFFVMMAGYFRSS